MAEIFFMGILAPFDPILDFFRAFLEVLPYHKGFFSPTAGLFSGWLEPTGAVRTSKNREVGEPGAARCALPRFVAETMPGALAATLNYVVLNCAGAAEK